MGRSIKELLVHTESMVLRELTSLEPDAAALYCMQQTETLVETGSAASVEVAARGFYLGLWFVEHAQDHGKGEPKAVDAMKKRCELFLSQCGIRPESPRSRDLYSRLYYGLSAQALVNGDAFLSAWQMNTAQTVVEIANAAMSREEIRQAADRAFDLGYMRNACAAYYYLEEHSREKIDKAQVCLARVRCLRLLGRLDEATDVLATVRPLYRDTPFELELNWEASVLRALSQKTLAPVTVAWDPGHAFYVARYSLFTLLLTRASGLNVQRQIPSPNQLLVEHFPAEPWGAAKREPAYAMIMALDHFADRRHSLIERLGALGVFLSEQRQKPFCEEYLLCLAAACRALLAARQRPFLAFLMNEYQSLGLRLSAGQSVDPLGLLPELLDKVDLVDAERHQRNLTELPVTSSRRILKLSSIVTQAGMMSLHMRVKQVFGDFSESQARSERMLTELAEMIVEEFGRMKGPMMKIAQFLLLTDALPAASKQKIQKALANTAPMDPKIFEGPFKAQFGKLPRQVFRNWDDTVIGVGTTAQVFRAALPDGRPVAVKMMYPELPRTVAADVVLLKLMKPLLRSLLPGVDVDAVLSAYIKIFADECDFSEEARKQRLWADALRSRPKVLVPGIYDDFSSQTVLTSDFIPGQKLYDFARTGSLSARVRFLRELEETLEVAVCEHGLAQFDPHGGNFLHFEGKIVLLDFGTAMVLPPAAASLAASLWRTLTGGDALHFYEVLTELGILNAELVTAATFCDQIAPLLMAHHHPAFDPVKHRAAKLFELYFRGGLRHSLVVQQPEVMQLFLEVIRVRLVADMLGDPIEIFQERRRQASAADDPAA